MQALNVVERRTRDVWQRDLIYQDRYLTELGHDVTVFFCVEAQRVLKTGASPANNRDSKSRSGVESFLIVHLFDSLDSFWRELYTWRNGAFGINVIVQRLILMKFL